MSARTKMLARINANRVKAGEKPIKPPCCTSAVPGLHSANCPTWGIRRAQRKQKTDEK